MTTLTNGETRKPAARKATARKVAAVKPSEPAAPPPQERLVNGKRVIKVDPELSPMTNRAGDRTPFHNREILTLEDGSTVFGCTQCWVTDEKRGAVMRHYKEAHAQKRASAAGPAKSEIQSAAMQMTLGELFQLANGVASWEADRERLKAQLAAAQTELADLRKTHGKLIKALDKAGLVLKLED